MTSRQGRLGFTLVEIVVVAPIIILAVGAFIATIVSMTGEVMFSRGSNTITYEIQDSLNRIEQDIKLSMTFLAENNIEFSSSNPQGTGSSGTGNFANVSTPDGTVLILAALATNGNPLSEGVGGIYANSPNSCSSGLYAKNHPLYTNIIYFVDDNTLWRRTVMPTNYTSGDLCGGTVWQQPSCAPGYSNSFCKTEDIKLLEGVSASDFSVDYFSKASDSSPVAQASSPSVPVTQRNVALTGTQTASISISVNKRIAGRDISRTGTIRATRLDTNATAIADIVVPSLAGTSPTVSVRTVDSQDIIFEWLQLDGATSYTAQYRVKTAGSTSWGAWTNALSGGSTSFSNANRHHRMDSVGAGANIEFRVRGVNSQGVSSYGNKSVTVPFWAPLQLQNNWENYGGGYSPAQFTRSSDGVIMLTGLIRRGATANDTLLGTLPEDYRPTHRLIFGVAEGGSSVARIDIHSNGNVVLVRMPSTSWVSLQGIKFLASDAPVSRISMTPQSGWTNYGGSYAPLTSARDGSGRTHLQGLARPGTTTSGTTILTLPTGPAHGPTYLQYISSLSSNSFSSLSIHSRVLTTSTTGSGWTTIQTMHYADGEGTWMTPTMQNGWSRWSDGRPSLQYSKGSDGIVTLRNLVRGGTITNDTVIANLPPGYRPGGRQINTIVNNHAHGRVDVRENGDVMVRGPITSSWVAVDGISFMAEN